MRAPAVSVLVVCTVIFGSACGVSGTPLPSSPAVDVAKLDAGPYSTTARVAPDANASDVAQRVEESQRMANFLVDPFQMNDTLTKKLDPTGILYQFSDPAKYEAAGFGTNGLEPLTQAAQQNNFIGGAWVSRGDGKERGPEMSNSIMRFPDSDSAARASAAMSSAARDWSNSPSFASVHKAPAVDISIPGYPDAHAYYAVSDYGLVSSWYATGSLVIHTNVVQFDQERLATAAVNAKVIDRQIESMREFVPTSLDKLSTLPVDKEGILTRAVAMTNGQHIGPAQQAYYAPAGILHFADDAAAYQRMMADAGVDLIGYNASILFRAKDRESAWRMQSAWLRAHRKGFIERKPDSGQPEIECVDKKQDPQGNGWLPTDGRFKCAVAYGRYMAEVESSQRLDVDQMAAAQLALLVKNP